MNAASFPTPTKWCKKIWSLSQLVICSSRHRHRHCVWPWHLLLYSSTVKLTVLFESVFRYWLYQFGFGACIQITWLWRYKHVSNKQEMRMEDEHFGTRSWFFNPFPFIRFGVFTEMLWLGSSLQEIWWGYWMDKSRFNSTPLNYSLKIL